jgi:hypothetical protein
MQILRRRLLAIFGAFSFFPFLGFRGFSKTQTSTGPELEIPQEAQERILEILEEEGDDIEITSLDWFRDDRGTDRGLGGSSSGTVHFITPEESNWRIRRQP